jgi:hypothetical protein
MTSRYFLKAHRDSQDAVKYNKNSASHYIIGNPQARAVAAADQMREFAGKQRYFEEKRLRTHQQKIDVQSAESHYVRQNTFQILREVRALLPLSSALCSP